MLTYTTDKKRSKSNHSDPADAFAALDINEDGMVKPYDAFADEGHPPLFIYHPSRPKAEKNVSEACKTFLDPFAELEEDGYKNEQIKNICEKRLDRFIYVHHRYPTVGPIACLGPAGVGKSSAMNCLLHQLGAAPESDSAHRGTNLVHEFSAAYSYQTALCRVSAPFLREHQVETLIRKHCNNIFAFLDPSDDLEDEENEDLQKKYDTGVD